MLLPISFIAGAEKRSAFDPHFLRTTPGFSMRCDQLIEYCKRLRIIRIAGNLFDLAKNVAPQCRNAIETDSIPRDAGEAHKLNWKVRRVLKKNLRLNICSA